MDFIGLDESGEELGSILMVVDRFSQYATFIVASMDCTAEEAACLLIYHVVKFLGHPEKHCLLQRTIQQSGSTLW